MSEERAAWDRRDGESSRAYAAFRAYRDLGPTRSLSKMPDDISKRAPQWSQQWDWVARATAWDDTQHMIEDAERLDALRVMHRTHQVAGRMLLRAALEGLRQLDTSRLDAGEVAALARLGAQLERETLSTSVAELQGQAPAGESDPWDVIARELSGA